MHVPRDWVMGLGAGGAAKPTGWHSGIPAQTLQVAAGGTYSTDPAASGSVLNVYTPSAGVQYANMKGGGSVNQLGAGPSMPVEVILDGTQGTLVVSWPGSGGQIVSASIVVVGLPVSEGTIPGATKIEVPCTAPQVADSVTGLCVSPCWDGSVPASSVCPPVKAAPPVTAPAAVAGTSASTVAAAGLGALGVVALIWYFA